MAGSSPGFPLSSQGSQHIRRLMARTERTMAYLSGKALEDAVKEQHRLKEKLKCA